MNLSKLISLGYGFTTPAVMTSSTLGICDFNSGSNSLNHSIQMINSNRLSMNGNNNSNNKNFIDIKMSYHDFISVMVFNR